MSCNILILGVNGFIGSHLLEGILNSAHADWKVTGVDIHEHNISAFKDKPNFEFHNIDICKQRDLIEEKIKHCDVVLPLVAIATPAMYVKDPLRVFELDFEENLKIIRLCVKHKRRVIFPSTSEVYGMCQDGAFNEETSPLVTGPINKSRWIYSSSKQLLDRVIAAYGEKGELDYTLFRPFNWIGPRLDDISKTKPGSSRVLTTFIGNIIRQEPIQVVGGGAQERTLTYIDDGIRALIQIIDNKDGVASKRIFNIGNPDAGISILELANTLVKLVAEHPKFKHLAETAKIEVTDPKAYYGEGYQDVQRRVPSIDNAHKFLDWQPKIMLEQGLSKTLNYYLDTYASK